MSLLRTILLLTFLPALASAADLSEGDEAVKSARESLAEQWDMPWYSAEADDLRPVTVKVPPPPSTGGFWKWLGDLLSNLFGGNLSLLAGSRGRRRVACVSVDAGLPAGGDGPGQ